MMDVSEEFISPMQSINIYVYVKGYTRLKKHGANTTCKWNLKDEKK